MIIREERYGRPAASRLLLPTLREVKFRTNSGNFHFPVLFRWKFKAAFPNAKPARIAPIRKIHRQLFSNYIVSHRFSRNDDPSLSPT